MAKSGSRPKSRERRPHCGEWAWLIALGGNMVEGSRELDSKGSHRTLIRILLNAVIKSDPKSPTSPSSVVISRAA